MNAWRPWDWGLGKLKQIQAHFYAKAYRRIEEEAHWSADPLREDHQTVDLPPLTTGRVGTILVYKPDEIGDAVYALPALTRLREAVPKARIILMCTKKALPVYERAKLVDEIVPVEARLWLRRIPLVRLQKALSLCSVRDFDVAVFLRTYPAYFHSFRKIPARHHIHPRDPRMTSDSAIQPYVNQWGSRRAHQAVQLSQVVSPLTGSALSLGEMAFPKFHWSEEDVSGIGKVFPQGIPARFLVVHPYANFETRRYPADYWDELLTSLHHRYKMPVVVIGGKEDGAFSLSVPSIAMQGKLSLGQTGYLMSRATLFIGNESGPGHWAAAMGTPTVFLMGGHSAFSEWRPLGKVRVIRTEVPCAPCHLRSCARKDLACLTRLEPDRVFPIVVDFIEGQRPSSDGREISRELFSD